MASPPRCSTASSADISMPSRHRPDSGIVTRPIAPRGCRRLSQTVIPIAYVNTVRLGGRMRLKHKRPPSVTMRRSVARILRRNHDPSNVRFPPSSSAATNRGGTQKLDRARRKHRKEPMRRRHDEGHFRTCAKVTHLAVGRPCRHIQIQRLAWRRHPIDHTCHMRCAVLGQRG